MTWDNQKAMHDLGAWLAMRRYMRATYPQERFHAKYEGGAAIHIAKDGRFLGVW